MFAGVYSRRRVLITGNTGFKGSWLGVWLTQLGAEVCGVALPMPAPSHHELLQTEYLSKECDIRDYTALLKIFHEFQPEIVFHLAAQPLVRLSYRIPADTFSVNAGGTMNVLECCRHTASVRRAVVVTTDKCYENPENGLPFAESAPLGGYDPYSGSKAAAEMIVSSYRRSFFAPEGRILCASARAGNVIGGGDWAADRLIPDMVRAAAAGVSAKIRNPHSVRPWQHVLEPLSGYLWLGTKLLQRKSEFAEAWNFGPRHDDTMTVGEVAAQMHKCWEKMNFDIAPETVAPHEAALLRLDCSKAENKLGWHGVWNSSAAIERTALWYREFYENNGLLTVEDLNRYIHDASEAGLEWTR